MSEQEQLIRILKQDILDLNENNDNNADLSKQIDNFFNILNLNNKGDYAKTIAKSEKILNKIINLVRQKYPLNSNNDKVIEVQAFLSNIILKKYQEIILTKRNYEKKGYEDKGKNAVKHKDDILKLLEDCLDFDITSNNISDKQNFYFLKYYNECFKEINNYNIINNNNICSLLSSNTFLQNNVISKFNNLQNTQDRSKVINLMEMFLIKEKNGKPITLSNITQDYTKEAFDFTGIINLELNKIKNSEGKTQAFEFILKHGLEVVMQQDRALWYTYCDFTREQIDMLNSKNYKDLSLFKFGQSSAFSKIEIEGNELKVLHYKNFQDYKNNEPIKNNGCTLELPLNFDENINDISKYLLSNSGDRASNVFINYLLDINEGNIPKENINNAHSFFIKQLNKLEIDIKNNNLLIDIENLIPLYCIIQLKNKKIKIVDEVAKSVVNGFDLFIEQYNKKYLENDLENLIIQTVENKLEIKKTPQKVELGNKPIEEQKKLKESENEYIEKNANNSGSASQGIGSDSISNSSAKSDSISSENSIEIKDIPSEEEDLESKDKPIEKQKKLKESENEYIEKNANNSGSASQGIGSDSISNSSAKSDSKDSNSLILNDDISIEIEDIPLEEELKNKSVEELEKLKIELLKKNEELYRQMYNENDELLKNGMDTSEEIEKNYKLFEETTNLINIKKQQNIQNEPIFPSNYETTETELDNKIKTLNKTTNLNKKGKITDRIQFFENEAKKQQNSMKLSSSFDQSSSRIIIGSATKKLSDSQNSSELLESFGKNSFN